MKCTTASISPTYYSVAVPSMSLPHLGGFFFQVETPPHQLLIIGSGTTRNILVLCACACVCACMYSLPLNPKNTIRRRFFHVCWYPLIHPVAPRTTPFFFVRSCQPLSLHLTKKGFNDERTLKMVLVSEQKFCFFVASHSLTLSTVVEVCTKMKRNVQQAFPCSH